MNSSKAIFKDYVQLARPDHWFKNIFMLPGILFATAYFGIEISTNWFIEVILAVVSLCLIASANYVINEYIDAKYDKYHPIKKTRTSVQKKVLLKIVILEYVLLFSIGMTIAWLINLEFFISLLLLLVMGMLYNIPPIRTKDKPYIDVLSESVNNPIRFALGWFLVTTTVWPPSSIMIAYWMAGAFLMATKRYAEYRFIDNPETAGLYRKSFKTYTEDTLIISAFFYALTSTFFLGIFLVKNKIELLLSFPFFALLFAWYLRLGLYRNSIVQRPERLYKNRRFMWYVIFLCVILIVLLFIDIPALNYFLKKQF